MKYVLHPTTKQQLARAVKRPRHAILLVGASGIGKGSLARQLAQNLLQLPDGKLATYPHLRLVQPSDNKAISIETIRELEHFLALKIPSSSPVARIVIIEDSQTMTPEAQNALLKTLEEPPADTVLILTTTNEHALLPTIRSRLQIIPVNKPSPGDIQAFFSSQNKTGSVAQAVAISGGLPGLTAALLNETTEHPLTQAVQTARQLLQANTYERLLLADALSKQKELARDVCYILGQMAQLSLIKDPGSARWRGILKAAYEAEEQLLASGQPKLVLTNLMLNL